jgi:hypothetical protein
MKVGFIVGRDDPTGDGETYETKEIKDIVLKKHKRGKNKQQIMIDVGIAYYIKIHYPDIEVDVITPNELTEKRLQKNDINFQLGYDVINAMVNSPSIQRFKNVKILENIFKKKANKIYPSYNHLEFIWSKTKYMKFLESKGIPTSKTLYFKKKQSVQKLKKDIQRMKWKQFIVKPIGGTENIGIGKFKISEIDDLDDFFNDWDEFNEYIVQEIIYGFSRFGEIKTYWINGTYSYGVKIFNFGEEYFNEIDTYIEPSTLKRIKQIGTKIIQEIPKPIFNKRESMPVMLRIDFACCQNNKSYSSKQLFVNEIEYQDAGTLTNLGVTYPVVPVLADTFVKRARELLN